MTRVITYWSVIRNGIRAPNESAQTEDGREGRAPRTLKAIHAIEALVSDKEWHPRAELIGTN